LRESVAKLLEQYRRLEERELHVQAALVRRDAEVVRLAEEVERYRNERMTAKEQLDSLIQRFDDLGVSWERVER
jgi:hypothetical protein